MKIKKIQVYQVDLPVANGPYTSSDGDIYEVDSTVVEIVCDNGLIGYGECCPSRADIRP